MSIDEFIRNEVSEVVSEQIGPAVSEMFYRAVYGVTEELKKIQKYKNGDLLSDEELSTYLGIGRQTLAQWRCSKRHIPFVTIGDRLIRYRYEDVLEFINRSKVRVNP